MQRIIQKMIILRSFLQIRYKFNDLSDMLHPVKEIVRFLFSFDVVNLYNPAAEIVYSAMSFSFKNMVAGILKALCF